MTISGPVVVFAGPSIHPDDAARVVGDDAIVLPPASAGDLLRSLRLRPRAIALVDGRFDDVPSTWHKELLLAIERGVHVFGGASMGALRAVECERFGAKPVGRIADSYRRGRREDDAVAITHLPSAGGWQSMSTALVDIEARLDRAVSTGEVDAETAAAHLQRARECAFPERRSPFEPSIELGLKHDDAVETCRLAASTDGRTTPGLRTPRTTWLHRLARTALATPFPAARGLPAREIRFRAVVEADPDAGGLLADAITFGRIELRTLDRCSISDRRADAIRVHHLARVHAESPIRGPLSTLALGIADQQRQLLEAAGPIEFGEGPSALLDPAADSGARDDALARVIRSEGLSCCRDLLLESDVEDPLDVIHDAL